MGDLEGELLQLAHTCASSATEVGSMEMPPTLFTLGASSSVAAGCCVSASPPPLVVDGPVYLGYVQFGSVLLLTTKGVALGTFSPDIYC